MACSVAPAAAPHQMFHRAGAAPHQMMTPLAPEPEQEPEPEEVRFSDFDWIGDLGAGGFARVIKARHRRTGAVFALKMSYDPDPDVEEEAEVLRRAAGSPHVVDCHALLRGPDGEPACLLEFMDAGSLSRVLQAARVSGQGRRIPRGGARRGGRALRHGAGPTPLPRHGAHGRMPDNFLANSRGETKIGDFNTSKILYGGAGEHLQVSLTAGTRCYLSPERFAPRARAGPQVAMAADVWGLGVTVLEMFLGRFPVVPDLEKASSAELELAICHRDPLRVPEEAEASAELRGFVAACLQREPTRHATVPQLLRHPFLTGRDVEASRRALRDLIVETL